MYTRNKSRGFRKCSTRNPRFTGCWRYRETASSLTTDTVAGPQKRWFTPARESIGPQRSPCLAQVAQWSIWYVQRWNRWGVWIFIYCFDEMQLKSPGDAGQERLQSALTTRNRQNIQMISYCISTDGWANKAVTLANLLSWKADTYSAKDEVLTAATIDQRRLMMP